MPKYMVQASYVGEGLNGLIKEGGTKRREAVAQVIESMGGTLESFYYVFGDYDVVGVAEMPDNVTGLAFSLMVNASGVIDAKTIVLLTPEEIDQATKKTVNYRPPGLTVPVRLTPIILCLIQSAIDKGRVKTGSAFFSCGLDFYLVT